MQTTLTHAPVATPMRDIYTVSRLNREVRAHLEMGFPLLWLEGEISNFARPASGHFYFSLKDDKAQVRCAMFRNRNMHIGFTPKNGMQILVRARISLYEGRGEFQLIIEHMEQAGDGALRRAFEELKQRLDREGLFASEHKQPLPALPRTIGVVTSPSGAAVHDILHVLKRRFPAIRVIIYPVPVQGAEAPQAIADTLTLAARRDECDVLIVGRGGGSLEDLWAFNDERVARAIYACPLPVVSAVGHEIDFSIADFVADQRAPTPSAAAEMLSPDSEAWLRAFSQGENRLQRLIRQRIESAQQRVDYLQRRLIHPGRRLQEIGRRLDEWEQRLLRAWQMRQGQRLGRLGTLSARLQGQHPGQRLNQLRQQHSELQRRLHQSIQRLLQERHSALAAAAHNLQAVSPLSTLTRGYAIVLNQQGEVLRDSHQAHTGERIETRLGHGRLYARIEDIEHEKND